MSNLHWPAPPLGSGRLDDDRHDRRPRRGRVAARAERLDRGGVEAHLLGGPVRGTRIDGSGSTCYCVYCVM